MLLFFFSRIIPIYLVHRPSNNIPYATLEEELIGDFVKYSVKDGKEINLMRRDSEAGQKCCAFQHWVYHKTEGNLLVTDMQGWGEFGRSGFQMCRISLSKALKCYLLWLFRCGDEAHWCRNSHQQKRVSKHTSNSCVWPQRWTNNANRFVAGTKASRETALPLSSTSSKRCTSATSTVRYWASIPCSPKLRSLQAPRNPRPSTLLQPRRKHLGQQWRGSHNTRTRTGFISLPFVCLFL